MEEILNSLRLLFSTYGFRAGAIIVATIIIVNLIKKPIVKKAEAFEKKTGADKSVITKYVTLLPIAVALALEFFVELALSRFAILSLDYGAIVSSAILYGALATATYESVKKQLEAYSASINIENETPIESKKTTVKFNSNGPEN